MARTIRRFVVPLVLLALLGVIASGLLRPDQPRTSSQRVAALAADLRCPVCKSTSVADSPSETAREMRTEITEQVAAGRTDQQVVDYYVNRYGPWIELSPPVKDAWLLWLLPVAVGVAGAGAIVLLRRRRRPRMTGLPEAWVARVQQDLDTLQQDGATGAAETPLRLREHRDATLRDLADLQQQEEAGEIAPHVAAALREQYTREAALALQAMDEARGQTARPAPTPAERRSNVRRTRRRVAFGGVALGLAIAGALLTTSLVRRPPGAFVTGFEVSNPTSTSRTPTGVPTAQPGPVNLQLPELDAAIKREPGPGAQLVAAHRLLNSGDLSGAMAGYTAVLRSTQDPQLTAAASTHAGWLVSVDGNPRSGSQLVQEGLRLVPDQPEALWLLAQIRLNSLNDPQGAVAPLRQLQRRPDLPGQVRTDVARLLRQAQTPRSAAPSAKAGP